MYVDPDGHMPEWLDCNWEQIRRAVIVIGAAALAVTAVAVATYVSGGSIIPVLVGAAVGAGTAIGVSAGCQFLSTGRINIGKLLVDTAVGAVSGAFGGTALNNMGMFYSGFGTGFLGSIAEDLVETGSFTNIRIGAAICSGILGGVLGGISKGAQYDDFTQISRYNNRIKISKTKGLSIHNKYYKHALSRYNSLIKSANIAIIKSIPMTFGSNIIDFYF